MYHFVTFCQTCFKKAWYTFGYMRRIHVVVSWGVEFGPIFIFFLTSEWLGFIKATELFVGLTGLALAVAYVRDRRIALFPLIAGLSVIGFGALTVFLDDPFYLIIKDTLYNGIFALALAIGLYGFKKPLLKNLFNSLFLMTERGWMILSQRWMVAFALLALSNEVAWRIFDAKEWIIYKMGATFITLVFGLYQLTLSRRERLPESNRWGMNPGPNVIL